jgi:hypothetical protein
MQGALGEGHGTPAITPLFDGKQLLRPEALRGGTIPVQDGVIRLGDQGLYCIQPGGFVRFKAYRGRVLAVSGLFRRPADRSSPPERRRRAARLSHHDDGSAASREENPSS